MTSAKCISELREVHLCIAICSKTNPPGTRSFCCWSRTSSCQAGILETYHSIRLAVKARLLFDSSPPSASWDWKCTDQIMEPVPCTAKICNEVHTQNRTGSDLTPAPRANALYLSSHAYHLPPKSRTCPHHQPAPISMIARFSLSHPSHPGLNPRPQSSSYTTAYPANANHSTRTSAPQTAAPPASPGAHNAPPPWSSQW